MSIYKSYCSNCEQSIEVTDRFCSHCGQENKPGKPSFRSLVTGFFSGIFNWDSKIIRTPIALLWPGYLPEAFMGGKRKRYTPPGRFLLFSLFAYLTLFNMLSDKETFYPGEGTNFLKTRHTYEVLQENRKVVWEHLDRLHPIAELDSGVVDEIYNSIVNNGGDAASPMIHISPWDSFNLRDMAEMKEADFIEKHQLEKWHKRIIYKQTKKLLEHPEAYAKFLIGLITWVVIFSIPLSAIWMKLLYWRRKHFFVEHVIFLIYWNIFFLISGTLPIAGYLLLETPRFLIATTPLLLGLPYGYLALKRYYKQGWFKTLFKYSALLIGVMLAYASLVLVASFAGVFLF